VVPRPTCVTLHGGHEADGWLLPRLRMESKTPGSRLCSLPFGLGAEIGEVVSGREAVAVLPERAPLARPDLSPRASSSSDHGTVHGRWVRAFFLSTRGRKSVNCHDAVGYLGLDVFQS